ncbi:MAG: TIGR01777 family protein [Alphaproteobacteria bacterium]|nr:TIGR01777 family protein [Alphaproteobacteria bacterium]
MITQATPERSFEDVAVQGPFARWRHRHAFAPHAEGTELQDEIHWALPGGVAGDLVAGRWAEEELLRMLRWRHAVTRLDLARWAALHPGRSLRVAVTGASGLVGSALCDVLRAGGHEVVPLVRRAALAGELAWDPARGQLDPTALEGLDGVVHLAGAPIAQRWTPAGREAIVRSRVEGTTTVARALATCRRPPPVLVSASAVGVYGHRHDAVDEDAAAGAGFLADTGQAWEAAAQPAREAGLRVVHPRIGIVQSARGGALGVLLPLARLGLAGRLGTGRQALPWIALDDLVWVLITALLDSRLEGPVNAVAPERVDQATHAATLARVLRRPLQLPAPALAVRALLGERGQALLLEGAPVVPARLDALGFPWALPTLEGALRHELGLPHPEDPRR